MLQTPTQTMFMFALLGIFLIFPAAHADDFAEMTLHNDSALEELSAVRNWTLICEHLCSLNLSGPACGPDCPSTEPVSEDHENLDSDSVEYTFQSNHQDELCETLCDNGLGGKHCACPISIRPAASAMPKSERDKVCSDFCRFHQVTLRGCKRCPYDKYLKKPVKNSARPPPPPPLPLPPFFAPSLQTHRFDSELETPSRTLDNLVDGSVQVSPTTPTTPDWNRVCATLCRQGTGGILCNCDLAPF